jgi:1-acyl-sn-glycerol-3-phosphate acyltransferase
MLSLIYSMWDSIAKQNSAATTVSYLLSFCTRIGHIYDSLPEYAIVDSILAIWTAFHVVIAVSIVSVSDAPYKEPLIRLHYRMVKTFHDIPLFVTIMTFGLVILTANLCYKAQSFRGDDATLLRAVVSSYTLVCCIILRKISNGVAKLGPEFAMKVEQDIEKHDIANWEKPPKWTSHLLDPLNLILRPDVTGADNIPTDHPALYVSNHSLHGIEMGTFVATIYALKNVFLRGISDKMHFGQLHGEVLRYFGGVNGSRENVSVMMEAKHDILVYPGGSHEIQKPSTVPKYQLMWKERLGFARLAIRHGYPLVPCAAVGTEDMLDIVYDIPLDFYRKDQKLPIIAPVLPHRLQRVYFWFGTPIPTCQYQGDWQNDAFAREVRDRVKAAVEHGIREMQEKQTRDPNRYLYRHIANIARDSWTLALEFCKNTFAPSCALSSDETTTTTQQQQQQRNNNATGILLQKGRLSRQARKKLTNEISDA